GMPAALADVRGDIGREAQAHIDEGVTGHDAPGVGEVAGRVKVGRDLVPLRQALGPLQTVELEGAHVLRPVVVADHVQATGRGRFQQVRRYDTFSQHTASRRAIPYPNLVVFRPAQRDGLKHLQEAGVGRATAHSFGGAGDVLGEWVWEGHGELVERRHDVRVVLISVAAKQPGSNVQRHRLVEAQADRREVLLADNAEATIILPDGHARFAEEV